MVCLSQLNRGPSGKQHEAETGPKVARNLRKHDKGNKNLKKNSEHESRDPIRIILVAPPFNSLQNHCDPLGHLAGGRPSRTAPGKEEK